MPLLIICGIPGSGKTTVANKIKDFLVNEKHKGVILINEESLKINKEINYIDTESEKNGRLLFRNSVDRSISRTTTVICDSINYIKGFRYELYCVSKSHSTPTATVWMNTGKEKSKSRLITEKEKSQTTTKAEEAPSVLLPSNTSEAKFPLSMFEDFCNRFEQPNEQNRWDRPLFIINEPDEMNVEDDDLDDAEALAHQAKRPRLDLTEMPSEQTTIPFEEIYTALYEVPIPKPNLSTKEIRIEDSNTVYRIDQEAQEMCQSILQFINSPNWVPGDKVPFGGNLLLSIPRKVTVSELRHLRTQFVKMGQQHLQAVGIDIRKAFADFLKTSL